MRDSIFISHANPEDNEFAQWLALQLAKQGFPVWCDLTKLLGGEDWWKDIQNILEEKTIKFLYVLSKASNKKDGTRRELMVANNVSKKYDLKDFVIPLRIDDLDYKDFNIELARLNAISFKEGWADGLKPLLKKLEEDKIPKSKNFSPDAVTSWWKEKFSADAGVILEPDEYLSNWFPVELLPDNLFFHRFSNETELSIDYLILL